MNAPAVNRLHRYIGICVAPCIVIQTVSGLFLEFGLFRRASGASASMRGLDPLLLKIHFGPGWLSDAYHLLLGAGIIWMACSGWLLYLRLRRARKRVTTQVPSG